MISFIYRQPTKTSLEEYNKVYKLCTLGISRTLGFILGQLRLSNGSDFHFTKKNESTLLLLMEYLKCAEYTVMHLHLNEISIFSGNLVSELYNVIVSRCLDFDMQHKYIGILFTSLLCEWPRPIALQKAIHLITKKDVVFKHLYHVPEAIHSILLITRSFGDEKQQLVKSQMFETRIFDETKKGFRLFVVSSLHRKYVTGELTDNLLDEYSVYLENFNLL